LEYGFSERSSAEGNCDGSLVAYPEVGESSSDSASNGSGGATLVLGRRL
jgi:hypothetical protein